MDTKTLSLGTPERLYTVPNMGEVAPVQAGQSYEFLFDMSTRAGHVHPKGSILHVEDSTTSTPHHELSASGKNWICRTDFGTSVWATLEQCISRGAFKLMKPYQIYFWYLGLDEPEPKDRRGRLLVHRSTLDFTSDDIEELSARYDVMISTATKPPVIYLSPIGSKFGQR